jgi:protocatechuate 3,4-dioxygenase beta subunit
MKKIPRIILAAILLGVILLHTTCNKKAIEKITLQGYVYDSLGGKPVSGIWVILWACDAGYQKDQCDGYIVGQAQTDASGHFYIHDDAATSNRYNLRVVGTSIGIGNFEYDATSDWMNEHCATIYLR